MSVKSFLGDAPKGSPAFKFEYKGDECRGEILAAVEQQQTDFATGDPLFWAAKYGKKAQPRMQLVLTVQTADADPEDEEDDGTRRLYLKGQSMTAGIKAAVKGAGGSGGIEIGDEITCKFVQKDPKATDPKKAAKLYEIKYVRSGSGVDAEVEDEQDDEDEVDEDARQTPPRAPRVAVQVVDEDEVESAHKPRLSKRQEAAARTPKRNENVETEGDDLNLTAAQEIKVTALTAAGISPEKIAEMIENGLI